LFESCGDSFSQKRTNLLLQSNKKFDKKDWFNKEGRNYLMHFVRKHMGMGVNAPLDVHVTSPASPARPALA
jgi:hypothetical protein